MTSFVFKNFLHSFEHRTDQFLATFCNFVIMVPDRNNGLDQLVDSCTVFDLSLFLIIPHKFSMGFKSGKFPGILKPLFHFLVTLFALF